MKRLFSLLAVFAISVFLPACKEELVCEDDSYIIIEDRCIKKDVNDITFVVPENMEEIEKISVYNGDTFTLPTLDIDFDYGWYKDADFTIEFNPNVAVNKDTKVYLKVEGYYTFVYHIVGETEHSGLLFAEPYYVLPETDLLPDVQYTGYQTSTWYTDETLTTAYSSSLLVDEDYTIDLFIHIEKIPYTVSYVAPEIMGEIESDIVLHGDYVQLPVFDYERIVKYYTDPELTTQFNARITQITRDLTLYIGLEPPQYMIYYQLGSSTILEIVEYDNINEITSHPTPERQGFDFIGWYLDKDLTMSIDEYDIEQDELYPITRLYADYDIHMYDLIYILNGEEIRRTSHAYNEVLTIYQPYSISNWYIDEERTIPFTDLSMPAHDVTLYASVNYNYNTYSSVDELVVARDQEQLYMVEVTGIVESVTEATIYISSGNEIISAIYLGPTIEPGTEVTVIGMFYYYSTHFGTRYTLNELVSITIVSEDNTLPIAPIEASFSDIQIAETSLSREGLKYNITGTITYNAEQEMYTIVSGDDVLYFNTAQMLEQSVTAIEENLGNTVNLTVMYLFNSWDSDSESFMYIIGFDGTVDDIVIIE